MKTELDNDIEQARIRLLKKLTQDRNRERQDNAALAFVLLFGLIVGTPTAALFMLVIIHFVIKFW